MLCRFLYPFRSRPGREDERQHEAAIERLRARRSTLSLLVVLIGFWECSERDGSVQVSLLRCLRSAQVRRWASPQLPALRITAMACYTPVPTSSTRQLLLPEPSRLASRHGTDSFTYPPAIAP